MNRVFRAIITMILALSAINTVEADKKSDTAFSTLYKQYFESYNKPGATQQFYDLSNHMKNYYLERKDYEKYYMVLLNEAIYDAENGQPYSAIRKANAMLDEMKKKGHDEYDKVYMALGTVYENRGNVRMAEYYYEEALKAINTNNNVALIGTYSHLAYLKMFTDPQTALKWNRKYAPLVTNFAEYQQVNLFIEACCRFIAKDKEAFRKAHKQFETFHRQHQNEVDNFGLYTLSLMGKAMDGHYAEALSMLKTAEEKKELNEITALDLSMTIHQIANEPLKALTVAKEQRMLIDSLNTGLLFNNLNELNTQANLAHTKYKTAKKMERMAWIIIVLAFITIIVLAIWIFMHRRMRQHLVQKNQQLKLALAMAEESDRMKTEFVRQVSHEIRTPLNAINGFNEILNGADMQLTDDERQDLLSRIKTSTKAITDIVDEMLHLSEQESSDYYARHDQMLCNKVLSELLYKNRSSVSSLIELNYTTEVINRFTILTNEASVKQIVEHLIQNAIKFTTKGSINLHCRTTDKGQTLEISITDTGRGINPEMRDKVFEMFVKEDSFEQGMGLGLTVSRKIAQKLGGNLVLDESYSGGSRFVLTLPVQTTMNTSTQTTASMANTATN